MKKAQKKQNKRAHKNQNAKLRLRLLVFILGLFFIFAILQNLSVVKNYVSLEKAFAITDTKGLALLPTVTPTPTIPLMFNSDDLFEATPTVIPTPKIENITNPQNDFCIDVPILIYHHVQPLDEARALGHAQLTVDSSIFDEQMKYLVDSGYNIISVSDVVSALQTHTQLPPKSIVVTLDDGYDDFYNYAFPIAKKHNVKMDFMIPSGLINNPGYMTWDQLKEISQSSLISIYNHTWSHAALGYSDRNKIEFEVTTSQNELQSKLGKPINIMVYPYGSFSPLAIQILKEHGFVGGISTIDGTMQCSSYIMTLHRTHIGNAPLSSYGF